MFTSLQPSHDQSGNIMFGDNEKGEVLGLGKIAISNDNSISNVLLVNSLNIICCLFHNKMEADNGTEFKNTNIEEILDEEGINYEFSVPYTPQQNSVVERKNRTLIEAARAMLDEYKTPTNYWAEVVNTTCHATNRLYLHKKREKIAYELLTGKIPKVHYFRVFGSNCFILNKKPKSSKFALKVDEGFILGYGTNEHGYHVFNKTTG
jgi:hypothetical protein